MTLFEVDILILSLNSSWKLWLLSSCIDTSGLIWCAEKGVGDFEMGIMIRGSGRVAVMSRK